MELSKINKMDQAIFYCLCGVSLSTCLSIGAASVFLGLAILLFFCRLYIKRDDIGGFSHIDRGLVGVTGLFFISILFSSAGAGEMLPGIRVFLDQCVYRVMPLILVLLLIKEKKKLAILAGLVLLSLTINSAGAIWQGIHGDFRAAGPINGIMVFSGILSISLPLLWLTVMQTKTPVKKYLLSSLLIVTGGLLFNGTRSAWLTVLIVSVLVTFLASRNKKKYIAGSVVVFCFVGFVFANVPQLRERLNSIGDPTTNSRIERVFGWQGAWEMFRDHPLTGVGQGHYRELYKAQYKPLGAREDLHHAHNNFMQILAESGIAGMVPYTLMMLYFLYYGFRGWVKGKNIYCLAFGGLTLGLILHGLADFNLAMSAVMKLYWLLAALCIQMMNIDEERFE